MPRGKYIRSDSQWAQIDPDWLRNEYVDKCRTQESIADELGVSKNVIHYAIYHNDIKRAPAVPRIDRQATPEEVSRLYLDENMSQKSLAAHFGVSEDTMYDYLIKHNIRKRGNGQIVKKNVFVYPGEDPICNPRACRYWPSCLDKEGPCRMG